MLGMYKYKVYRVWVSDFMAEEESKRSRQNGNVSRVLESLAAYSSITYKQKLYILKSLS